MTGFEDFIDVGSICVTSQRGVEFNFQLLWVAISAGVTIAVRLERSGSLAAAGRHMVAGVRQRIGGLFDGRGTGSRPGSSGPAAAV